MAKAAKRKPKVKVRFVAMGGDDDASDKHIKSWDWLAKVWKRKKAKKP